MFHTSSFFYYIIIRFCHPYGVLWWVGHPPVTPFGRVTRRTHEPCVPTNYSLLISLVRTLEPSVPTNNYLT